MLTLFKKFFGKSGAKAPSPLAPPPSTPSPAQMQFESAIQMAKVEVARLSLKAIATKFPEDVRALLLTAPDDNATVALPIQTILKQLPSGVVRMSLASLHRQAPRGLLKPLPQGDKRMVEVPLAEVFKHVKPGALKRRADQRQAEPVDEDFEAPVFNSRIESTPAPKVAAAEPEAEAAPEVAAASEPTPAPMRSVAPPSELNIAVPKTAAKPVAPQSKVQPASSDDAVLVLPLADLSEGWADEIREALSGLDGATKVAIPHLHIAPGLARGKISCTWTQLRNWLQPKAPHSVAIDPEVTLLLPLKLIAPAFLATKRPATAPRKSVTVDESIPALFSGNKTPAEVPPAAIEAPALAIQAEEKKEEAPVAETPLAPASQLDLKIDLKPATEEPAAAAEADAPVAESTAPETPASPEASKPTDTTPPQTVGEALGEPDRTDWTPAAVVKAVVKLPGVAGAVVALQEGFQVAHALPEGVSAETVSAFLPQIFTRLNQYAGEMKLGEVDDLLFTTRGAHCMIYRLGGLYFAVLGQPGETLPWDALRLAAAELSRQVQK